MTMPAHGICSNIAILHEWQWMTAPTAYLSRDKRRFERVVCYHFSSKSPRKKGSTSILVHLPEYISVTHRCNDIIIPVSVIMTAINSMLKLFCLWCRCLYMELTISKTETKSSKHSTSSDHAALRSSVFDGLNIDSKIGLQVTIYFIFFVVAWTVDTGHLSHVRITFTTLLLSIRPQH